MIADSFEHINCYAGLGAGFAAAIAYLQSASLDTIKPGHYPIDGENVYANVVERELTQPATKWEAHDQYADIHLILAGNEQIGCYPRARLAEALVCDTASDCAVTKGLDGVIVPLRVGEFVIALPQDVHMPNIPSPLGTYSKKLIVKIRLDK